jgi:hypothetical protein
LDEQTKKRLERLETKLTIATGLLCLVVLSVMKPVACSREQYPGLYEWWTDGRAQLVLDCSDQSFFDNVVTNNFVTRTIASVVVPLWNTITYSPVGRGFLLLVVGGLFVAALYDYIKRKLSQPV